MRKGAGFLGRNRFKKEKAPELPDPETFTVEAPADETSPINAETNTEASAEPDGIGAASTDGVSESGTDETLAVPTSTDLVEQIKAAKAEAITKLPKENAEERRKVNERRRLILIGCGAAAVIVLIAGVILYNVNKQRTGENVSLPEVANINQGTTSTQAIDLAKLRAEADRISGEQGLLAASVYYQDQLERTKNPLAKYNSETDTEPEEEVIEEEESEAETDTSVEVETDLSGDEGESEASDEEGSGEEEKNSGYQYNITKSESMSDRAAIWLSYANFLYDYLHSEAANSLTAAPEDGSEYVIGVESREFWNEALLSAALSAEKTYPCKSTAEAYAKYLREYRTDDPFTADYYAELATIRTR